MKKSVIDDFGNICVFDEERHLYTVDSMPLTSVTTLIHKYFPKFDTDKIAKKYADKHGLDKDKVIEHWEKIKKQAAEFGTKVHKYAEERLLGIRSKILDRDNKHERKFATSVNKAIRKITKKYTILEVEKMVFSVDYMISGTIDIVVKEIATGDIIILDWKTNKEIKKDNMFQCGLPPITHLDDCNWEHYCLQLNLYKKLLLGSNKFKDKNIRMGLIHLKKEGVDYYKIPDKQTDINKLINDFMENKDEK